MMEPNANELMQELVMLRTLLIAAVREHGPIKLSFERWTQVDHGDWAPQVTQTDEHIVIDAIVMGQVTQAA
jgi:hypothetical protein